MIVLKKVILLLLSFYVLHISANITSDHVEEIKTRILGLAQGIADWTAVDMHQFHPETKSFKLQKYRGITPAEVEMMQVVVKRLQNKTIADFYDEKFFKVGHKCTPQQQRRQIEVTKRVVMGICTEESAYKIAHLGYPEARVFIDVGANKGYTTALIAGLWEGDAMGLTPYLLFKKYEELKIFQTAASPAGYCRTGFNRAYPLHCPDLGDQIEVNRHPDGQCDYQHNKLHKNQSSISIYAIDGSSSVINSFRSTLDKMPTLMNTALGRNIHTFHLAMSDKSGTVRFRKKSELLASGYEGGGIVGASKRALSHAQMRKTKTQVDENTTSERVEMTTLSKFALFHHIRNNIDFIKIDAEGHDLDVIRGANNTLSSVGVLMWEQSNTSRKFAPTINMLESMQFECYIPSFSGFFKITSNCAKISRLQNGKNIVCASRSIAPAAVLLFDLLSHVYDDM